MRVMTTPFICPLPQGWVLTGPRCFKFSSFQCLLVDTESSFRLQIPELCFLIFLLGNEQCVFVFTSSYNTCRKQSSTNNAGYKEYPSPPVFPWRGKLIRNKVYIPNYCRHSVPATPHLALRSFVLGPRYSSSPLLSTNFCPIQHM